MLVDIRLEGNLDSGYFITRKGGCVSDDNFVR